MLTDLHSYLGLTNGELLLALVSSLGIYSGWLATYLSYSSQLSLRRPLLHLGSKVGPRLKLLRSCLTTGPSLACRREMSQSFVVFHTPSRRTLYFHLECEHLANPCSYLVWPIFAFGSL